MTGFILDLLVAALVVFIVMVRVIASFASKWVNMFCLAGVCCCVAASSVNAQVQLMSPEKEAALRASIPPIEDEALAAKIAEAMLYTDAEIPAAYQFQPLAGGQGVDGTVFYSPNVQLNQIRRFTNGNKEFPWRTPGGLDFCEDQCDEFRFIWLPKQDNGRPWPVVIYRDRLEKSDSVNMPIPTGYKWLFPLDTVVGEVLVMNFSDGLKYTFEMRIRIREMDDWEVDIFRPFPTLADLKAKIAEVAPDHPALVQLDQQPIQKQTMRDTLHQRSAFESSAGVYTLPRFEPELSKTLLTTTPFRSAMAKAFAEAGDVQAFAATANHPESIVPAKYMGTFMGNDRDSCRKCHEHSMKHVDRFDNSDWYGYSRSVNGIFSFNPIDPSCIGPPDKQVRFRQEFLSAGMIDFYDPAKHPTSVYQIAPLYEHGPAAHYPNTGRRTIRN